MRQLTSSQRLAIEARGNVLVVAGAGTGKTSTLVSRCVDRIVNEGASLERILMVTFTDAAAVEMRHRIGEALEKALAASSSRSHEARSEQSAIRNPQSAIDRSLVTSAATRNLEEQLALIPTAQISTLSSFCLELVRDHFHELHLDPQLVVLDEERLAPLIAETLDALFKEIYASADERAAAVRKLIRQYGGGSDFAIRKLVLKIHRYTQTLAQPQRWFDAQVATFSDAQPTQWREWLREGVAEWRALWLPAIEQVAGEATALAHCARALRELAESPTLDDFFSALESIRAADSDNELWQQKKTALRRPLAMFFKEVEFLAALQPREGKDPLVEDWECVHEQMLTLLNLAHEFGERFGAAKRELGGLDFADIEQLALKLLVDGGGQPTPVAEAIRAQFDHVFVDEYQDINEAQDAIIRAVSSETNAECGMRNTESAATPDTPHSALRTPHFGNRFLVGDVKQSIYRFRLAQPKIFTSYDQRWSESSEGTRIPLSDNFRSREAILNFVNPLFTALMRRSIGGLDYSEDARLVFGKRDEREHFTIECDGDLRRVELHLIAKSGPAEAAHNGAENGGELLDLESVEREARLIARRLRELHESGLTIRDKNGVEHPVEYRDMVVLMRSPSDRAEAFAKQFHKMGVPLRAARAGFYDALEVSDLLCLMHLLDNPLQDLPLLAVLRSPLVALSPEELVEVRCAGTEGGWWPALHRFRTKGWQPELIGDSRSSTLQGTWKKVNTFLRQFERWRELMLHCSVSQVLETVLTETHYESLLATDARGPQRLANARRFIDLSRDYDPLRRQGLYRFLRFIDAQRAAEVDHEPAPAQADNAVQLMSIHRSKGLEFPVVVVANIGGTFNEQHLNEAILLSEQFGLSPKVFPPDRNVIYPSVPHWLAKRAERRELIGEEMRLLYVALTRARDMLILTGTAPGKEAASRWPSTAAREIGDAEILKTRSYLDWLRLWLPQVTTATDWTSDREGACTLLHWKFYVADDAYLQTPDVREKHQENEMKAFDAGAVLARIEQPYPFAAATEQPAKSSVSVLRRNEEDEDAQPLFFRRDWSERPSARGKLSARDIGIAHHRFQQFVELNRVGAVADLESEAKRLTAARLLEAAQAGALNFDRLHAFWTSDVGRQIRQHAAAVRRELEFTARFKPAELADIGLGRSDIAEDFIVIQGVADLAVFLPTEIWLLDFKTDDVSADEVLARAQFHAVQLEVYGRALERIYRKRVTRRWLHFFAAGRTIDASSLSKNLNAERAEKV